MRASSFSFVTCAALLAAAVIGTCLPASAGTITAKANITFCEVQAVDCIESDLQSC